MKRFEALPEGYVIRKPNRLAASTLRSSPPKSWVGAALDEIAETGCWTEWGHGHHDAPAQNAMEARGLIEVARPDGVKRKTGRHLFRATPFGIRLLNEARAEWGKPPLPVSEEPHVPTAREFAHSMIAIDPKRGARGETWPENLGTWELHEAIMDEQDRDRLDMLNAELRARLDADALPAVVSVDG